MGIVRGYAWLWRSTPIGASPAEVACPQSLKQNLKPCPLLLGVRHSSFASSSKVLAKFLMGDDCKPPSIPSRRSNYI